ncbi:MAG: pilin [Wohlfahrtiimonas sp.]
MRNAKGFTLIELMIVVAIICILAMIALPAYQTYTKKVYVAEGMNLFTSIKTAVIENHAVNGAAAATDFVALGFSESQLVSSSNRKRLKMSSPLKYIDMETWQYNMIPEPVNRFTLVFDDKVGKVQNELVIEMYPAQLDANNQNVVRSNYKTVCVTYLKTNAAKAIPHQYLPATCKPSKER